MKKQKYSSKDLTKFALEYLCSLGHWAFPNKTMATRDSRGFYRKNTTYCGAADIICALKGGGHLEVEIKGEGDRLRPEQAEHRDHILRTGNKYIEMHTPEDLTEKIS